MVALSKTCRPGLERADRTNSTEFTFKPEGNQTVVSWSMFGKNNFMGKAMGLIMDCDKMLGGQFEQGLANMKSAAENGQQTVAL